MSKVELINLEDICKKLESMDDKKLASIRTRAKKAMTSLSVFGDMLLIAELTNFGFNSKISSKEIYLASTLLLQERGKKVKI